MMLRIAMSAAMFAAGKCEATIKAVYLLRFVISDLNIPRSV